MQQLYSYQGHTPKIAGDCFIAPGAMLIGDVEIGEKSSVWYNCVLRGDVCGIRIGKNSNIQDGTVIHTNSGHDDQHAGRRSEGIPAIVGDNVSVGHNCILHACTVEDCCLIGMGATVLDGAVIGRGSIIGAGAVVTKNTVIPPCSVVLGTPGRVVRTMNEQEAIDARIEHANHYRGLAEENMRNIAAVSAGE